MIKVARIGAVTATYTPANTVNVCMYVCMYGECIYVCMYVCPYVRSPYLESALLLIAFLFLQLYPFVQSSRPHHRDWDKPTHHKEHNNKNNSSLCSFCQGSCTKKSAVNFAILLMIVLWCQLRQRRKFAACKGQNNTKRLNIQHNEGYLITSTYYNSMSTTT